ncbi:MAG TPA: hypothetical protein VIU83_05495 [Candidatus Deferrimicrobium sp.]
MEKETGLQDSPEDQEVSGTQASKETGASAAPLSAERWSGPTWRGWVLSILVAIALSVTATLLLGDSGGFRSDRAVAVGSGGVDSGGGSICCPPAAPGK